MAPVNGGQYQDEGSVVQNENIPVVPESSASSVLATFVEEHSRQMMMQVQKWTEDMDYSDKYADDVYEYRRVTVPRDMLQLFPQERCMNEFEWRRHGILMSMGWEHYDHHTPEANILLFRRVLGTNPKTGEVPFEMQQKVQERIKYIAELEQTRQRVFLEQARRREQMENDVF